MTNDIHIGIVGGGITGVSTAYFLAEKGFNPYIIEAGKLGKGDDDKISGSYPPPEPKHYLMITTPYDSSLKLFLKENGNGKAEKYFELSNAGCYLMKSIAKEIDGNIVKELGSLYVGSKRRKKNLEEELKGYREMGYGEDFVRFWSKEKISELYGTDKFYGGLFFPRDAIMDGRRYLIGMLSKYKERINVVEDAELTRVEEIEDGVKIEIKYKDGKKENLTADYVIFATNGFYKDRNLAGLVKMKWSFEIFFEDEGPDTPNTFIGVYPYYYFTRQNNILMIGGEDREVKNIRYSKDEKIAIDKLTEWARKKFSRLEKRNPACVHFGIWARTKDQIPIVGKFSEDSRIIYAVGCNGMVNPLVYGASLIPYMITRENMDEIQRDFADFLSPKRFKTND